MPETIPTSLLTTDAAAGHALAHRLATRLLPATSTGTDMASHLRTSGLPGASVALVTAIYFHAITVANQGWRETPTR